MNKEVPLSEKVMHYRLWAKDVAEAVERLKGRFTAFKLYSREEILKEIKEEFGDLQ